MSVPRAAAQPLRMPVPFGYSFRPLLRGRGTAQRAIPTIALPSYPSQTRGFHIRPLRRIDTSSQKPISAAMTKPMRPITGMPFHFGGMSA